MAKNGLILSCAKRCGMVRNVPVNELPHGQHHAVKNGKQHIPTKKITLTVDPFLNANLLYTLHNKMGKAQKYNFTVSKADFNPLTAQNKDHLLFICNTSCTL